MTARPAGGMVSIVVVGSDAALLEGIAQLLATAGHAVRLAATLADASEEVDGDEELPLVALVERELLAARGAAAPALAPGGATVLYRTADGDAPSLPARVQRATLAEVTLPLERNRLLALVQHVVDRRQATGRPRRDPRSDGRRPPT